MAPQEHEVFEYPHHGPQDFNELLVEQLRRTPWFMTSLAIFIVAYFLFKDIPIADVNRDKNQIITAQNIPVEDERMEDIPQEPPPPEEKTVETEEEVVEEEVTEEAETNEESLADSPFQGKGTNAAIGLGGGAGGAFGGRRGGRGGKLKKYGGEATQEAVEAGLEWLKNHQTPDEGFWDCDNFQAQCKKNICDGKGYPLYDPGVSGLALLAFLGAGYTHREGKYKKTVADAIKYLRKIQDPEGCFGNRTEQHYPYSHSICTLAMAEAYALTESPLFRSSVEKGLQFLYSCQNPHPSGTGFLAWRYNCRSGQNDTSVTGWMIMALKSAYESKNAFPVNRPSVEGAVQFLNAMTDQATGKVGYTQVGVSPVRAQGREEKWPNAKSEAITAVGLFSRIFGNAILGVDSGKDPLVTKAAQLMAAKPPVWNEADGSIDHYYWYYGTLAMFQVGGEYWKKWNSAMKDAIIKHQRQSGDEKGSWDPVDPWGEDGGRVYSTALLTMCLEVYYRYGKVFGTR